MIPTIIHKLIVYLLYDRIYLFHMFYAWLISTITGFSILYKDEITAQTVVISVLIALASLALSILTGIIADIISGKVRKQTKK